MQTLYRMMSWNLPCSGQIAHLLPSRISSLHCAAAVLTALALDALFTEAQPLNLGRTIA